MLALSRIKTLDAPRRRTPAGSAGGAAPRAAAEGGGAAPRPGAAGSMRRRRPTSRTTPRPRRPSPPRCVSDEHISLFFSQILGTVGTSLTVPSSSQPLSSVRVETPDAPSVRCSSAVRNNFGIVKSIWTKTLNSSNTPALFEVALLSHGAGKDGCTTVR